jgi:hypothetical protein
MPLIIISGGQSGVARAARDEAIARRPREERGERDLWDGAGASGN